MKQDVFIGPVDPAARSGYPDHPPRMGFFTDTSICIGCKACEVACKEWNEVPDDGLSLLGMSYDNTGALGADTWRHVAFIEQSKLVGMQEVGLVEGQPVGPAASEAVAGQVASALSRTQAHLLGTSTGEVRVDIEPQDLAASPLPTSADGDQRRELRWLMASDVCKHCTHAACLDVCPTGALFRTEFGTVVVQEDVCNGCGYCVPACPYGVIDKREPDGRVWKCTLCYDRIGTGLEPACAKACPTDSIQYGELDELRERAQQRVTQLHEAGVTDARLYGDDPHDGVGGAGAFFLLLDEPEVYGFPPDPVVTSKDLPQMWKDVALAAGAIVGSALVAFAIGGRR